MANAFHSWAEELPGISLQDAVPRFSKRSASTNAQRCLRFPNPLMSTEPQGAMMSSTNPARKISRAGIDNDALLRPNSGEKVIGIADSSIKLSHPVKTRDYDEVPAGAAPPGPPAVTTMLFGDRIIIMFLPSSFGFLSINAIALTSSNSFSSSCSPSLV